MLDAILATLPDSAFFTQNIASEELVDKLLVSDSPFECHLRGAVVWELTKYPSYSVYSIGKTNNVDNVEPGSTGYGSVVLSSIETGEVLTYPMRDDSGKMPLAKPSEASSPPPGATRPRPKTYSVDDIWRTLTPQDFRGGYGEYQAFLHLGNIQSNPYRFQVRTGVEHPPARPYEALLKLPGHPVNEDFGIRGVTFTSVHAVDVPTEPGVFLKPGKPSGTGPTSSLPIHGAFRFTGTWPKDYQRMPLHFLIRVEEVGDVFVHTLWLPRSQCHFQDGAYTGHFNFDLADLFITPWDGKRKPPKRTWISTVHCGWQGPIVKYEFQKN